ncbi:hypothetical protein [Streptomyces niveus]|uniref:hypothetical protein n=1 Tax=Streptomyces niveus TaxID=193462 RepID=UPI00339F314A
MLTEVIATRYVTPLREGGSLPGIVEDGKVPSAEAEAEARHAYRIEQNRPWFRALPDRTAAIAAETKAAAGARERAAQHLLAACLEQPAHADAGPCPGSSRERAEVGAAGGWEFPCPAESDDPSS